MTPVRVSVLGDVHGNARALRAALAAARLKRPDRLVLMGDLLTYGHDIDEVLDLVGEAQSRDGAGLLIGNHDQMYFDLLRGDRSYFEKLPSWIQETVARTMDHPRTATLEPMFQWSHEIALEPRSIAAHANPFGARDWAYLNDVEQHARAATVLRERSLDVGVFAHTHRARWFVPPAPPQAVEPGRLLVFERSHPTVLNAGAVGQPRDGSGAASLLFLELASDEVRATFEHIAYDVGEHVASLSRAGLSDTTVQRLSRFFETQG